MNPRDLFVPVLPQPVSHANVARRLPPSPNPATLVARPRLDAALQQIWSYPLTLVVAPAGFGKTTALHAWYRAARVGGEGVAWLALDAGDNDPAQFWSAVLAALRDIEPTCSESALALLQVPQPQAELFVTMLLSDLAPLQRPAVLVLDDFHAIEHAFTQRALQQLIDRLPPHLHIVVASRTDPALAVARWRAYGQLLELHARELRFSDEEAALFINQAMALGVTPTELRALNERTEGWIVGLRLAALSLRDEADRSAFLSQFVRTPRYIADYLLEEVMERQPADVQQFLMQTAILEQLHAPLCDAVMETHGAQEMLRRLEHANLFLDPLDGTRTLYRYHHLFAEVLLERLRATNPAIIPVLHQRAAAWYRAAGLEDEAIEHLLAAGAMGEAAALIDQRAEKMLAAGGIATLRRWIGTLPDAVVQAWPRLALVALRDLLDQGDLRVVEARLAELRASVAGSAAPRNNASLEWIAMAVESIIERLRGAMPHSIVLAQEALASTVAEHSLLRAVIAVNLGITYHQSGELAAASAAFLETVRSPIEQGEEWSLPPPGPLDAAAVRYFQRLLHAPRSSRMVMPLVGVAFVSVGEILYEWNALDLAEAYIRAGFALVPSYLPESGGAFARGYSILALIQLARNEPESALALVTQAEQAGSDKPPLLLDPLQAYRAQVLILAGDIAGARRWLHSRWAQATPELIGQYADDYLALARVLLVEARLDEALEILHHLLQRAEHDGRIGHAIKVLVLRALVQQERGDILVALGDLEQALLHGGPRGFVRTFLDEGPAMATLLRRAAAPGAIEAAARRYAAYLVGLVNTPIGMPTPPTLPVLAEPLSERERSVVQLLATGATIPAIAAALVIAPGTVKRHIHNIYGKLDAHNRVELVAKARAVGILSLRPDGATQ